MALLPERQDVLTDERAFSCESIWPKLYRPWLTIPARGLPGGGIITCDYEDHRTGEPRRTPICQAARDADWWLRGLGRYGLIAEYERGADVTDLAAKLRICKIVNSPWGNASAGPVATIAVDLGPPGEFSFDWQVCLLGSQAPEHSSDLAELLDELGQELPRAVVKYRHFEGADDWDDTQSGGPGGDGK